MSEVTEGELAVGILQQARLASTVVNAISMGADLSMADSETKWAKMDYANTLNVLQQLSLRCSKDGYHIISQAIFDLQAFIPTMIDKAYYVAQVGRQGLTCTAAMRSLRMKMYEQQNFLGLSEKIAFELPEGIMKTKAMEWHLSAYRPANPTEQLTIEQYVRGHISATQAAQFLAIKGVPENLAFMLYDHYEKYPSVREMVLASEWIGMTDAQLLDAMKYDNITLPQNKTFYLNYMHAMQLRAEFNQYLIQLKGDYVAGLMTEADFIDEVEMHKPNPIEAAQIVENANKQKVRTLVNMEVQSLTWLYRKGEFGDIGTDGSAEETFYEALVAISMDSAMANALARFEACKIGYNWEHE